MFLEWYWYGRTVKHFNWSRHRADLITEVFSFITALYSSCWLPFPGHRTTKPRRSLSSWHFMTARNKTLDGPWLKENRHDQSILSMILKVENLVDSWWRISIGPLSCSDCLDKWHDWHGISMHYWNSKMFFVPLGTEASISKPGSCNEHHHNAKYQHLLGSKNETAGWQAGTQAPGHFNKHSNVYRQIFYLLI